jgi:hypothetical protein
MSQTNERAFETYVEEILLTRGGSQSAAAKIDVRAFRR